MTQVDQYLYSLLLSKSKKNPTMLLAIQILLFPFKDRNKAWNLKCNTNMMQLIRANGVIQNGMRTHMEGRYCSLGWDLLEVFQDNWTFLNYIKERLVLDEFIVFVIKKCIVRFTNAEADPHAGVCIPPGLECLSEVKRVDTNMKLLKAEQHRGLVPLKWSATF